METGGASGLCMNPGGGGYPSGATGGEGVARRGGVASVRGATTRDGLVPPRTSSRNIALLEARMGGKKLSSTIMQLVPQATPEADEARRLIAGISGAPVAPASPAVPARNTVPEKTGKTRSDADAKEETTRTPTRKRKRFSEEEDRAIMQGVREFGSNWELIRREMDIDRNPNAIRQRYRRIEKQQQQRSMEARIASLEALTQQNPRLVEELASVSADHAHLVADRHNAAAAHPDRPLSRGSSVERRGVDARDRKRPRLLGETREGETQGGNKRRRREGSKSGDRPSPPASGTGVAPMATTTTTTAAAAASASASTKPGGGRVRRQRSVSVEGGEPRRRYEQLVETCMQQEEYIRALEARLETKERSKRTLEQQHTTYVDRVRDTVVGLLREDGKRQKHAVRRRVKEENARLGFISRERHGHHVVELWKYGSAFLDLEKAEEELKQARALLDEERKKLTKRKYKRHSQSHAGDPSNDDHDERSETGGTTFRRPESLFDADDIHNVDEVLKLRLQKLKKREQEMHQKRARLDKERQLLIRDIRRIEDEDNSRFNSMPILNGRYMLLTLLGKGGFSEVYKAFDLEDMVYVACKIHQLAGHWSDAKKADYTRHAIREYQIHRELRHANIVCLSNVFEIDRNSFCTVLEYCEGGDLDERLKMAHTISEREARCIVQQIVSALDYINRREQPIIHYDLKPGNILFDKLGRVKITDFGLSKIVDNPTTEGLELTSQGAGTYWYLPPECFVVPTNGEAPRISCRVDVWSVGVMLYQMLFGRKPFGHDKSQANIMSENTILNAREVVFPPKPAISQDAKSFIRTCLIYNQADRPDIQGLRRHPYLRRRKSGGKSGASGKSKVARVAGNKQ